MPAYEIPPALPGVFIRIVGPPLRHSPAVAHARVTALPIR